MNKVNLITTLTLLLWAWFAPPLLAGTPIKIGIYQNHPLVFTNDDNIPQGIFVDILDYVAGQEGWEQNYVMCAWADCLTMLEQGEIDLLPAIAYSDQRAERYNFIAQTVLTNWAQVYIPAGSDVQSYLNLEGKTVAVLTDDIHYQRMVEVLKKFDIHPIFIEVNSYETVLSLVEQKEVEAGLVNRFFGIQNEARFNVDKSPIIFNPIEVRIAAPKGKNQALLNAIDKHLVELKQTPNSVYFQSISRWLEDIETQTVLPAWLIWGLAAAGTLVVLVLVLNITLRNQVRRRTAELVASEARYRALIENAPIGIVAFDRQGNIKTVNQAWLEVLHIPSVDAARQINLSTFPPLVKAGWAANIRQCLNTGQPVVSETPYTAESGQKTHLRSLFAPLKDSNGIVIGAQAMVEDIGPLVKAQVALEVEKERLQLVVENMPVMMDAIDEQGNILAWNQESEIVTGYSAAEVVNNPNAIALLYPDQTYRAQMMAAWQHRGNDYRQWEWEITCKNGLKKTVSWSNISARVPIPGWASWGVGVDITERKRVEEALRRREQDFHTLLTSIADYVWSADIIKGEVFYRYYSPVVEKVTGYPAEYFMTGVEAWLNLVHPQDQAIVRQSLARELAGPDSVSHEYRIIRPDGQVRWQYGITSPTLNQAGQVIRLDGVVSDITERKQLEEQLRQAQKMEAIGTLAGGIAHDFNNMLTAILGYAGLTLNMLPEDSPLRRDLEGIERISQRGANLVRQLLAYARRQVIEPRLTNLNDLIVNTNTMLHRLIGENIELITLPSAGNAQVKIDPGQFEQVLVNLAVNARDAMPNGGKLIIETADITIDETYTRRFPEITPGAYVMMAVADTGLGMSDEVKEHLFEPFFTTKEVGQGTGLGLATCFGIIKQNKGHINVYSELNHGTTFKVYLPLAVDLESGKAGSFTAEKLPGGAETILLVEDEPSVRDLAARTLEKHGYRVLVAANGEEALRLVDNKAELPIQLLLTDVIMPQMGGVELAEYLSNSRPSLKTLYMSGYADNSVIQMGILKDCQGFLQKPFTGAMLIRKVRELLDK
jgi:PAS domain S-box-containing protein